MCTVVIALKEPQFLGTLVQGVIASCDSSNVVQSREVKVGFCVAMVFQLRQEGEEVRGWDIGWQLEKLCTQRKRHTGRSGPESESILMLWEQWEKIPSMSCGSSSRLRLEAAVPMGHGKRCWAERTWYGTTDIFYRSPGLITSCKVSFNLSSRPWTYYVFLITLLKNPSASLLCFRWRWNSFKPHVGWRLPALCLTFSPCSCWLFVL